MDRSPSLIDLTHDLHSRIPTWAGSCGFEHNIHDDYAPDEAVKFRTHTIVMNEGIGTHMDAPAHCFPGAETIDRIPLSKLYRPCVVIDVSGIADETYLVSNGDIENFEAAYGRIPAESFVLIRTGWERFWNDPDQYNNNYFFPSLSAAAAKTLLNRGIAGIGIDTLSPDRGDSGFPVHNLMLGAGKYIVENVANLSAVPPTGGRLIVAPLKIKGGTEAPIRLMAIIDEEL